MIDYRTSYQDRYRTHVQYVGGVVHAVSGTEQNRLTYGHNQETMLKEAKCQAGDGRTDSKPPQWVEFRHGAFTRPGVPSLRHHSSLGALLHFSANLRPSSGSRLRSSARPGPAKRPTRAIQLIPMEP